MRPNVKTKPEHVFLPQCDIHLVKQHNLVGGTLVSSVRVWLMKSRCSVTNMESELDFSLQSITSTIIRGGG